jgi:hypothetical protein
MRVSCISFFGGLLLRFECAADGRQAQGLAVEHAKKAWAVSGTYRALNTAIEPAGYRGPFEFDALFTKAGQPAGACRLRRKKFDAFEIYRHRIFHKSSASARKALRRFSPARQGFEVVCSNHFDAF